MTTTNKAGKDEKCQICMNMFKIGTITEMLRSMNIKDEDFVCKNGHIKCSFCSYLNSDHPSFYRDYSGRTYLSNTVLDN